LGKSVPVLHHLRTSDRLHKMDLLAECPDESAFAFETKSASAVTAMTVGIWSGFVMSSAIDFSDARCYTPAHAHSPSATQALAAL
jgi:hypothetical protein